MFKYAGFFALSLILFMQAASYAIDYSTLNPVVEFRGVWLNADAVPKTERGIRELVRYYHKANINVLLPEVVARGYTAYPSKLLARDPRFVGACDPLPPMIDEAHKLGMEVHGWVWVFRAGYTKDRGGILTAHPDWVELSKYGEDLSVNGGLWISPAVPEARDFLAALYCELTTNYCLDGIHLDYIRYEVQSPAPYGYNAQARNRFKQEYGIDPIDIERLSPANLQWIRFRERMVTSFVHRIALQTRKIRPDAMISAAVGSDPVTARLNLLQNWPNWIDNRWVDFITPMAYTANDSSFESLVSEQKSIAGNKIILAPGIGLHLQKNDPQQSVRQIGITRRLSTDGHTLFASSYFGDPQADALKNSVYSLPATLPFRDPCAGVNDLLQAAVNCRIAGDNELSGYYENRANDLTAYFAFKSSPPKYVPPSDPPLDLPEIILPKPEIKASRFSHPIDADGVPDESQWRTAEVSMLSFDNTGRRMDIETRVRAGYDERNFYIVFEAMEPNMESIKAAVDKRDGPTFYDDSVELFIDPKMTRRDYYHLSGNSLATKFDQRVFNPGWNAEWQLAVKTLDDRWIAEMVIPFSAFGIDSPQSGSMWAINFTRNRTTSGRMEYIAWSVPYGSFHNPDRFGILQFN